MLDDIDNIHILLEAALTKINQNRDKGVGK